MVACNHTPGVGSSKRESRSATWKDQYKIEVSDEERHVLKFFRDLLEAEGIGSVSFLETGGGECDCLRLTPLGAVATAGGETKGGECRMGSHLRAGNVSYCPKYSAGYSSIPIN